MTENQNWNDIIKEEKIKLDQTIDDLKEKDKKYEVPTTPNIRRGMAPRDTVNYTIYSQPYSKKRKETTKKVIFGQNILFENSKKIKQIILKVIIAASLAGTVAFVAKYISKDQSSEIESDVAIEQEFNPESIAADFAKKEHNTPDEVDFIQDVNTGKYQDPLITDQYSTDNINAPHISENEKNDETKQVMTWSTSEGYTPLSQDANYNPPKEENIDQFTENTNIR